MDANRANVLRIAAVVFDMDGLMFNTEDLYDEVGQRLLEPRGYDFDLELKLKMMGRTSKEAFKILQQECNITDTIEELEAENDAILMDLIPRQIKKMPGLDQVIQTIKGINLPMGLATSSRQSLTYLKLEHFKMASLFDFIVTGDDVVNGKPHPEIYLSIAQKLNVPATEMLVFEDSVTGSTAAAAAGAYTIAVPGKHGQGLNYSHVNLVVPQLDDPQVMTILANIRN